MQEHWDIYDKHRNKTNRTIPAGTPLAPGEFHLIAHVCIFNSAGEMLIQQRHSSKKKWPNRWDVTAAGKVNEGETSQEGTQRELAEELGLHIDLSDIRPHLTLNFVRGFDDIFLLEREVELAALTLQEEEVQAVKWATKEEIKQMIYRGEFVRYYPTLIDYLFSIRKKLEYIKD